ncbi:MAG: LamG domain-containing protein [Bacteroidales bacterium]
MSIYKQYFGAFVMAWLIGVNCVFGIGQMNDQENPGIVARWKFDREDSRRVIDQVTGIRDSIEGNYKLVGGVEGKALKFDGFTTVIRRSFEKVPKISGSFSCEAWVAAATYPWNWCPILAQDRKEEAGFHFGVGPQGQAGIFASVNGVWQRLESKARISLRKWTHLVATLDEKTGFRIYIDGNLSGQLNISGKLVLAPESDLLIGMNREMTAPSNPVRAYATLPAWFSFDGIYDEIKIYEGALTPEMVERNFAAHANPLPPDIPERVMPSGPAGPGRFGAYYTKLKFYEEWDALFRVGDYADVVVQFDNSPIKVVFWRGTRYSPAWVMENGQWMADQSAEYFDTINGCFEHMIDPHCLYSHVRIIENTPARVVVHWRYIPVSIRKQLSQVDEKSGWSDCVDEYYTFYPDGIGIRKVVQYTSGEPLGPSEAIAFCQPGTSPEDNVNLDAMTLVNLKGESHVYSWANGAPVFKKGENPVNPVIQIVNLKSQYKPFMIFEPGNNMAVYGIEQRPDASHFPWWNHWPVAQLPSDGRYCQEPDRASHFSLAWGGPPFHDEAGKVIKARESGSEGSLNQADPKMKTVNTYWSAWIYGASSQTPEELATLARSWAQPPSLKIKGDGFSGSGYDLTQRAYIVECSDNKAEKLEMELLASEGSPVVNVCFVIKGWNPGDVSVQLDGRTLSREKDYSTGIIRNLEKDDLVLWIALKSNKTSKISMVHE